MQYKREQLLRQQEIMANRGFYKNKVDGIWGPASIQAKREWECDPSFIPALPNGGMPFGDRDTTPKGVLFDKATRMFVCERMTSVAAPAAPVVPAQEPAQEASVQINTDASDTAPSGEDEEPVIEEPDPAPASEPQAEEPASGDDDSGQHPHRRKKKHRRF